ncbi:mannose-1-phosphate guanylyltransferase/mannose-6-phosphate isomerase [Chlorobium sp. N1]|uniref:mannose-1-phosphate guanylyltransferase/mannose-6-phosphate isomerase n=1 Tax=Chlorobium sp. N1 TaxID=2491138 RepID=UPI00103EFE95|nr:mannose-1-phosphate guanylyltransferase/mannose-6-phosphate isomerase [Chlorobium sp. N1]TCD47508.1 mannose-1-phosphate guanylyltransferase/mannose-6-phosphate isomerase [Chlorobium sp. N1]
MAEVKLLTVIMAGGSGTRLWPLSRESNPKQFLSLAGKESMLQQTLRRVEGLGDSLPLVICNERHRFLAAEQLQELELLDHNVMLEPAGRNTAPAAALAALKAILGGGDPVLLVMAADHVIADGVAFRDAVKEALAYAQSGSLVTMGVEPDRPETGYGYIRTGEELVPGVWRVKEFVEKPSLETAESYLSSGDYFWNSGMFMFRASRYLEELEHHRPDILAACRQALAEAVSDKDFIRVDPAAFKACPADSIDYAVMEKTGDGVVVMLDAGWSDVGAFGALRDVLAKNEDGNALSGDVLVHDSHDNLVIAENMLVATVGLENCIVVQTRDAVLVASRDRVQEVKRIVESLKAAGRSEHELHRQVYRPWGHYDSVEAGERYQVKRICVNRGARLSVQQHHHRAEHWIVVSGTAKVTLDATERLLTENQSIYIPAGSVHSLENPGRIPLELIEVQSGSYLGEDDIVRLEDLYGRCLS